MTDDTFRLRVKIDGAGVVTFDKKKLRAVMRSAGSEVAADTRRLLRSSAGAGRAYAVRRRGAVEAHYASAPGQPPASRTGALAGAIRTKSTRGGDGVTIRDTMFYALPLEVGARGGGPGRRNAVERRAGVRMIIAAGQRVMEPRPFLSAALDALRPSIERRLHAAIEDGVGWQRQG